MGERFTTPDQVLSHWRLDAADPYRVSETKTESEDRRDRARSRGERASDAELIGSDLLIARLQQSRVTGEHLWGVFHAGTSLPVTMLKAGQGADAARTLAEALDIWRAPVTGEPFDWASDGLSDRLRSPYGRGLLDHAHGRDPGEWWAGTAPAEAEVHETDDGQEYQYVQDGSSLTVYAPGGLLIARAVSRFDVKTRKDAWIGETRDGRRLPGRWASDFVENTVQQHLIAQREPSDRDSLWIHYNGDRAMVHGVDSHDTDLKKLLRRSGFTSSGHAEAYVTAGTTRPVARAQSVDRLARALYKQGRAVEIRADENRLRGVLAPAAPASGAAPDLKTRIDPGPGAVPAAAAEGPAAHSVPAGALPVEQVAGYYALVKGGAVTVFGPDGAEIASARRASGYGSAVEGRVGDFRLVADGLGDGRLTSFAELAARHHRAVADPGLRDPVWVRWEPDGVAAVHGTVKNDDNDRRATKAGNLLWSGHRQAWATGRRWNPGTRDTKIAAVLKEFARQNRNVVVLGPGQTPEDLPSSSTSAAVAAVAVPAQQAPRAAAPPAAATVAEPELEDLTGLSDAELLATEGAARTARQGRYTTGTSVTYEQHQHHRQEIGRRGLERATTALPAADLSDEDLAAEFEWWEKTLYKTSFHSSEENFRTLERRKGEVRAERNGRTARALMVGPATADLDDEALESVYERIEKAWVRLPGGTARAPGGEPRGDVVGPRRAHRPEVPARHEGV
ncbi:hypothetical protein, partial [Streptomyces sp. OspMP-M43]|uniref:hypothetical protein n=1 Tax=Streptomyces sp. OspMP-M43 TaxID=1839781 RepID=UPI00081BAA9D